VGLEPLSNVTAIVTPYARAKFMHRFSALKSRERKTHCRDRNSLQKFAGSRAGNPATPAGLFTILLPAPASFLNLHRIYGTWSRIWADPA
jgi:hypothetical protein